MSTDPTLTPQIIGQAEKTMNAILFRLLAGPGLTEAQWITLTLNAAGGGSTGRGQLVAQVAHGLKVSEAQAREHLASLVAAQLVQDPVTMPGRCGSPTGEHRSSGRSGAP